MLLLSQGVEGSTVYYVILFEAAGYAAQAESLQCR